MTHPSTISSDPLSQQGQRRVRSLHSEFVDNDIFTAFDIRSSMFGDSHVEKLTNLYVKVFNEIPLSNKWDNSLAGLLIEKRRKYNHSTTVTISVGDGEPVAAAFIDSIPGFWGPKQSQADLIVREDYRNKKIGLELYVLCMELARIKDIKAFGENRFDDDNYITETQTYRNISYPKDMWVSVGYKVEDMFVMCAEDVLRSPDINNMTLRADIYKNKNGDSILLKKNGNFGNLTMRNLRSADVPALLEFISESNTVASDGNKWTEDKAKYYIEQMIELPSQPIISIALVDGKIVGCMIADTIPRRTGISLHHINCFASVNNSSSGFVSENVISSLFGNVVNAADHLIPRQYKNQNFVEIEFSKEQAEFFRKRCRNIGKHIKLDTDYVLIKGNCRDVMGRITEKCRKKVNFGRISLVSPGWG